MFQRIVGNSVSVIPKHSKPKVTTSRPLKEGTQAGDRGPCPGPGPAPAVCGPVHHSKRAFLFIIYVPFQEWPSSFPLCRPAPGRLLLLLAFFLCSHGPQCCVCNPPPTVSINLWDPEVALMPVRASSLCSSPGCVNASVDLLHFIIPPKWSCPYGHHVECFFSRLACNGKEGF